MTNLQLGLIAVKFPIKVDKLVIIVELLLESQINRFFEQRVEGFILKIDRAKKQIKWEISLAANLKKQHF